MHILEQYSLGCGLKIGSAFIYEKYFPTPFEKYITFNPYGKFNSRKYDYWQEVIDIIFPYLQEQGITIIQLGASGESAYAKCVPLMGKTDFNQTAYIIKNSLLHFGVDSFPIHIASHFNKKIVALYCNMYISQSGPYWSRPSDVRLIQADLGGAKPSYASEEKPKTINNIKPEQIANSICELLEINPGSVPITTFIGERYGAYLLESPPKVSLSKEMFPHLLLNIRLDYNDAENLDDEDYASIVENLSCRQCSLITDKPIDLGRIAALRNNINHIFYDVTFRPVNVEFVAMAKELNINLSVLFNTDKNNKPEDLASRRLSLIDLPDQIITVSFKYPDIEQLHRSTHYKSKKILVGQNGSTYLSRQALIEGRPAPTDSIFNYRQPLSEISDVAKLVAEDAPFCLFSS